VSRNPAHSFTVHQLNLPGFFVGSHPYGAPHNRTSGALQPQRLAGHWVRSSSRLPKTGRGRNDVVRSSASRPRHKPRFVWSLRRGRRDPNGRMAHQGRTAGQLAARLQQVRARLWLRQTGADPRRRSWRACSSADDAGHASTPSGGAASKSMRTPGWRAVMMRRVSREGHHSFGW
jgi:hypothetical protein